MEVVDLINDGSGLGFGIIGGRSTGVVVKTIVPGGVSDRVSSRLPLTTCHNTFQTMLRFRQLDAVAGGRPPNQWKKEKEKKKEVASLFSLGQLLCMGYRLSFAHSSRYLNGMPMLLLLLY